ncbi:phenylacetate--CoA ligase family protein [Streptoalloteichus hindustanus]|uniref:phenylacetate--CoA ligase family protein n=1 Tax=Streptoalloteichus hindustanus TaxID=2017 RepID=UPI001F1EF885|nr:phenylacetate--CoA ligase family protein [Streptoalloteichus hindustanus]
MRQAKKEGTAGLRRRQLARLAEMVAHARAHSPYYRELYRGLPDQVTDPTVLPVTNKVKLMDRFDDWVTDRAVTLKQAEAFAASPDLIGRRFHDKYLLATTSGTTGRRGIFLLDDRNMAVHMALSSRGAPTWLSTGDVMRTVLHGARTALLMATNGHFLGYTGAMRAGEESSWRGKVMRVLSVHTPLPELVEQLNRYRPVVLIGYASVVAMLAGEQEAGRLRINPVLVQPAGESLSAKEFERIATTFQAAIGTVYGATECPFMASSCRQGWLHVNSDWVVLEPVDADHRPTPPGEVSHTVLISNLANRVQPILRYDLGDGILMRPDPCPCGSPLPAIKVRGRAGDIVSFPASDGGQVSVPPLAFGTLVDRTPGIELFQIVQTTPISLRVRLRYSHGADPVQVWPAVRDQIRRLLADYRAEHVSVELAEEPPQQSPGGKYRTIIPLSGDQPVQPQ